MIKKILKIIPISLVVLFLFSSNEAFALTASGGDGILFYGAASNTTPQYKLYTNSTNNFGVNGGTVAGAQPAITVIKTSPTKQEAIGAYQDTSGNLRVLCYNGTAWTEDWTVAVAATGTPTTRRFDIAYETATGDVTVAYSRNTAAVNALAYRTKSGTTGCGSANWSAATNFPTTTTATSATVQWVKAARDGRSGQNLSTWVWRDNAATNADLGAAVWSGTAFGNFKVVETSMEHITTTGDIDNFDVQYESLSGDVMVVWGNSAGANGTNGSRYMTCTGGTATCTWGAATAIPSLLDDATTLDLSADPLSDKIAFASIGNAGSDLQLAYWSGTAWTGYPNVDTSTETPAIGMKLVTTGWLTNNGNTKWYFSYDDSTGTGIGYGYTVPGSAPTTATDFTSTPAINDIRGRYDTDINPFNTSELIQTISDSTNNIFAYRLSMNTSGVLSWSNMTSAVSLGTKASHPQQGFSYTYWRFVPPPVSPTVTTQAVTDNTTGNTVTGNGTVTDDGNSTITERGFVWNTSMDPTISNSKVVVSGTTGSFSGSITGLNENTLYYVRAYATNSVGTSYGGNVTFTTPITQAPPTIVPNTADAYNFATDTTPTLEMTATDVNGNDVQYNIQIGTSATFTGGTEKWIAMGDNITNTMAYSSDGINWTGAGYPFSNYGYGVAYNGSRWVAVGNGTNSIMYSDNGTSWTNISNTIFTSYGYSVAWNGSMWVATGSGVNTVAYSYDGINWTGAGLVFSNVGYGVAWNGSMWVAVGQGNNPIMYSYNGINWTGATLGSSIFGTYGKAITWGNGMWVATGYGTNSFAHSSDGINWTGDGTSILNTNAAGIAWNGTLFAATGNGTANSLAYSYDGINWNGAGKTIFTSFGRGMAWNGSKFVATGSGTNSLAYSSDGINWTGGGTSVLGSGVGVASNSPVTLVPSISLASGAIIDAVSSTNAGFLNTANGGDTQPFTSGNKVSYTVQAADALTPGTYYWRARAIDPSGSNTYSDWTAVRSFTITSNISLPTVTTQAVTSITATTATTNGNITNTGNENNDKRGVVYDTSSHTLPGNVAPTSSLYPNKVEETGSFAAGAFTENLTGLTQNTTYYVRAYSHNSMGYSYGGEVSFTATAPLLSASGVLESSVFDTTSTTSSVGYNSIMWKGNLGGAGQNEGKVKFQLAASSSPSGPWNYYGGSTCGALDWFDTTGPNIPVVLKGSNCVSNWNNKRYYRYKVMLCSASNCTSQSSSTPVVNKIIVNWSN